MLSSLQPQNVRARIAIVNPPEGADGPRFALLFDPQTAEGLLAGVPAERAQSCVSELDARGYATSAVVGAVTPRRERQEMTTLCR